MIFWRYVGTGRQDGLKIRCEQSRESSSLSGATKKINKFFIFFIFLFFSFKTVLAAPKNHNGQGSLLLTKKIIEEYFSYLTTKIQHNPVNFFITQDHKNTFVVIDKYAQYRGYSGSAQISRNKKKCENKYKQTCFLFSNQRFIVWNNGTNPIKKKISNLNRKITIEELNTKLLNLGFIETDEQKKAAEKKKKAEKKEQEKQKVVKKKNELTKSDHKDVQKKINFLLYIKKFLKENPEELDVLLVSELFIKTQPILKRKWNDELKKDFLILEGVVNKSQKFKSFVKKEEEKRIKKKNEEIKRLVVEITSLLEKLKAELINNLDQADLSKLILNQIKKSEKSLKDNNKDNLITLKNEIELFIIDKLKKKLDKKISTKDEVEQIVKNKLKIDPDKLKLGIEIETNQNLDEKQIKEKTTQKNSKKEITKKNNQQIKKNNSKFKIVTSNGRNFYEKQYFDEIISDSLLEVGFCKPPREVYICQPVGEQKVANILFKTPNDLTWFMFTGYGNLKSGRSVAQYPPFEFSNYAAGTVYNTNPKNFIQYKDPKFKIDHNQILCTQPSSEVTILKDKDCVKGVSVLTIDISFIKGKKANKFMFPTGLGSTNKLNMTPDERKFIMRDRMSFVIEDVKKDFVNNDTLKLRLETIGLLKRVIKGDDIILEPEQVAQTPGGGSKNYIDYLPTPYGYIINSYKFNEELEKKIDLATYAIQHKGEEIIPGTDVKTVLNNWNTLSELSLGYLTCVKDNSQNFENLTECSEKYRTETIKIVDWRTNNYYQSSTTDSIYNLTFNYLYPNIDRSSSMKKRIEFNKNGIRPISEILDCVNSKIKEMEFDSSIDLNTHIEQNCSSISNKYINYINDLMKKL